MNENKDNHMNSWILIGIINTIFILSNMHAFCQDLIALYPLDETAEDLSGFNNHGKIIGGVTPTYDRFGNPCKAMYFDGFSGYIEVPDSKSLKSITSTFSTTCWFKIDDLNNIGGLKWLTLICKGMETIETNDNPQYRVQTFQSPSQSTISVNTEFTEYDLNFSQHPFYLGKWMFYSLVYNGNDVIAYLNAEKIWEFPYRGKCVPNDHPMFIGKDIPGVLEYFYGSLDDVRLYKSALSLDEIRDIFNDSSGAIIDDKFEFSCIHNIETVTEKGSCYATVNFLPPISDNNCGKITFNQIIGLPGGSRFPSGRNLVAFKAIGLSGYSNTCYSYINVKDNESPTFKCNRDTALYVDQGSPGLVYQFTFPPAFDNCGVKEVKQVQGLPGGSMFPIGKTVQKFRAVDISGNQAECSYTIDILYKSTPSLLMTSIEPIPKFANKDSLHQLKFISDSIDYQYHLEFKSCDLTLMMYDDCIQDYDTVSVYFNTVPIVEQECIKLKTNGSIIKVVSLTKNAPNELVVKAWNIGTINPNTLKIEFYEGDYANQPNLLRNKRPVKVEILHSQPGIAGAMTLKCNQ
jgi:hypothetical protein